MLPDDDGHAIVTTMTHYDRYLGIVALGALSLAVLGVIRLVNWIIGLW